MGRFYNAGGGTTRGAGYQQLSDFAQQMQQRQDIYDRADAFGTQLEDPSQMGLGALSTIGKLLGVTGSAGMGLVSGIIGADHRETGDVATGSLWEGLSRMGKALKMDAHYGSGDFDALKWQEGDSTLGRIGKSAAAFVADNALDPITYLSFGTSLAAKTAAKAAIGAGEKVLANVADDAVRAAATKSLADAAPAVGETLGAAAPAARTAEETAKVAAARMDAEIAESFARGGAPALRDRLTTLLGPEEGARAFDALPTRLKGGLQLTGPFNTGPSTKLADLPWESASRSARFNARGSKAVRPVMDRIGRDSKAWGAAVSEAKSKLGANGGAAGSKQSVDAIQQFLTSKAVGQTLDAEVNGLAKAHGFVLHNVVQAFDAAKRRGDQEFQTKFNDYAMNPLKLTGDIPPEDAEVVALVKAWRESNDATYKAAQEAAGKDAGSIDPDQFAPRIVTKEWQQWAEKNVSALSARRISADVAGHSRSSMFFDSERGVHMGTAEANAKAREEFGIDFDMFETDALAASQAYQSSWLRRFHDRRAFQLMVESGLFIDIDGRAIAVSTEDVVKAIRAAEDAGGSVQERLAKQLTNAEQDVVRKQGVADSKAQAYIDAVADVEDSQVLVNANELRRMVSLAEQAGSTRVQAQVAAQIADDRLAALGDVIKQVTDQYGAANQTMSKKLREVTRLWGRIDAESDPITKAALVQRVEQLLEESIPKTSTRIRRSFDNLRQTMAVVDNPRAAMDDVTFRPAAGAQAAVRRADTLAERNALVTDQLDAADLNVTLTSQRARDAAVVRREGAKAASKAAGRELAAAQKKADGLLATAERLTDAPTFEAFNRLVNGAPLTAEEVPLVVKALTEHKAFYTEQGGRKVGMKIPTPPTEQELLAKASTLEPELVSAAEAAGYSQFRNDAPSVVLGVWATEVGKAVAERHMYAFTPAGKKSFETFMSWYLPTYSLWKTAATTGRGPGYVVRNAMSAAWNNWVAGVRPREGLLASNITLDWHRLQTRFAREGVTGEGLEAKVSAAMKAKYGSREVAPGVSAYDVFEDMRELELLRAPNLQQELGEQGASYFDETEQILKNYKRRVLSNKRNFAKGSSTFSEQDAISLANPLTWRGNKRLVYDKSINAVGNMPHIRAIQRVSELTESSVRGAALIAGYRQYGTKSGARTLMFQTQFDYGDLTPFERNLSNLVIPFYTWSKNNIPFQLRELGHRPGRFVMVTRLQELGSDVGMATEEQQAEFDAATPEWIRNKMGFVTGFNPTGAGNIAVPIDLPVMDLNTFFQSSAPLVRKEAVVSSMSPILKGIAESGLGINSDTGEMFDDNGTAAPGWANLLPGATRMNNKGEVVMDEALYRGFKNAIPQLGQLEKLTVVPGFTMADGANRATVGGTADEQRLGSNWLSFLGVSSATLTDKQKAGQARSNNQTLRNQMNNALGGLIEEFNLDPEWLSDALLRYDPAMVAAMVRRGAGRKRGE